MGTLQKHPAEIVLIGNELQTNSMGVSFVKIFSSMIEIIIWAAMDKIERRIKQSWTKKTKFVALRERNIEIWPESWIACLRPTFHILKY